MTAVFDRFAREAVALRRPALAAVDGADGPFTETARRMAERDGTNPDPEHPTMRRGNRPF